ncbi:golgin candidate 4-like [Panicum miliaceum]|uniref:Golgin candidate 4-like n=1 Tax=Panicum miliaceum TaxID=4540 RepID=A0A3L6PMX2_PANMI|nr:golgin candidate 4-like [Panicum miliaceum]
MRNSIATYRESLSRLAVEVDDAAADEVPAPSPPAARGGDLSATPPSSGRRRRYSHPGPGTGPGSDPADPDEISKLREEIQKLQASEAEIKALSFNYAAMLKEKEEQLGKLREENGSLKRNLESCKAVSANSNGTLERSPRAQRNAVQENSLNVTKQNGYGGGSSHGIQPNGLHSVTGNHKGNVLEEERASFAIKQASLENEIKQLKQQLSNKSKKETEIERRLEDENKLNGFLQQELNELKINKERISTSMEELHKELNEKKSELRRVQDELSRRDKEHVSDTSLQSLRNMLMALQKENSDLKIERARLEADLKSMKSTSQKTAGSTSDNKIPDSEKVKEEMDLLKRELQDASRERDKAMQDLARLKQHLLDKDLEDQEKMDEDSKLIEELRVICEQQRLHIMQLERALKAEIAKQEENKRIINEEHQRSNEQLEELKYKLASCMSALESKNVELLNLQTALGQYYAESEAKERLGGDLAVAREELSKLSESLKVANQTIEIARREKEDMATKLSQAERMLADGKRSMQKLEDDNSRLRRALEQSMTTVNRMSLDSDNSVDRRIVIKLLVTYFQRNYSKEVLDLMVRMLGFSEEDKQRIGFAQNNAGKGVVRGVLGLPGRLVGGIVGGGSSGKSAQASQDSQSFADLWVDFLLKETEEREKREASEAAKQLQDESQTATSTSSSSGGQQRSQHPSNVAPGPCTTTRPHVFGRADSEFSTVPLASSSYSSVPTQFSRPPQR